MGTHTPCWDPGRPPSCSQLGIGWLPVFVLEVVVVVEEVVGVVQLQLEAVAAGCPIPLDIPRRSQFAI